MVKLSNLCNSIAQIISLMAAMLLTALLITAVFCRLLGFSLVFASELSKLFFVWACFFALSVAFYRGQHTRFNVLEHVIGSRWAQRGQFLIHLGSLIFFAIILYQSFNFLPRIWFSVFASVPISQGWLYFPLPIIAAFNLVHTCNAFLRDWKALRGSS